MAYLSPTELGYVGHYFLYELIVSKNAAVGHTDCTSVRNGVPKVHHAIHRILHVVNQKHFKAPPPF